MDNDELYHYGVKGMKWGVRRDRKSKSSKNKTKGWSKDAKNAERIKKKSYHQMSNQELQALNKRMELESNYKRLNPSKISKGMKFVGTAVGTMGTIIALRNNSKQMIDIGKTVVGYAKKVRQ